MTTLIGLSGSLRTNSSNRKLLRAVAGFYPGARYLEGNLRLPLYDGDDEGANGVPKDVMALADAISEADAVLISTPEYNGGISGVLKNALDWISRTGVAPWPNKPVAVMSAAGGRSGGALGQTMLRSCMTNFRPRIAAAPSLMLADSNNQFDQDGSLLSEQYRKSAQNLMNALRADVELLSQS